MPESFIPAHVTVQNAAVALNQQMLPVFLGLLLTTSVAWLFLSSRLYAVLRQNHPDLYGKLGSPKLFMQKNMIVNLTVIRMLVKKDYETTGDPAVLRLCRGLRSLLWIYSVCLAGCILLLLDRVI